MKDYDIPFNKPYHTGKEIHYLYQAINFGKISGNGPFTQKCQAFFTKNYQFKKCLLTTSCTDALEMASILLNIQKGDEVIMPSFTFVSTANAFALRGANIVFADSYSDNPNIDASLIEGLITEKTKAIVVVHYAGIACDMNMIMDIANRYNLFVVEDAAHAIDSYYKRKPLGGIGHLAAFSFHETKNIISGEGGMLVINDERFLERAEIIWEKGTNRAAFFRGEINKYNWVDIGSSFLPSELTASFLFAQLEELKSIQKKRLSIWEHYFQELSKIKNIGQFKLPSIPDYATKNGHLFYLLCQSKEKRDRLIHHLKKHQIHAVFHYLSLHKSPFYYKIQGDRVLPNCDRYSDTIIRLPFYHELKLTEISKIVRIISKWK